MTVNFVTSNAGKVKSMQRRLAGFSITVKQVTLPLIEPQADSVEEIALSKAKQAYDMLKSPVLVEDSSFGIDELNGFPGPYIKYTLETIGIKGIMQLATSLTSRRCRFASALAYVDAGGEAKVFVGRGDAGTLATTIAPTNTDEAWSYLWRIFIPSGADKPLSALTGAERDKIRRTWQQHSIFTELGEWLKQNESVG